MLAFLLKAFGWQFTIELGKAEPDEEAVEADDDTPYGFQLTDKEDDE